MQYGCCFLKNYLHMEKWIEELAGTSEEVIETVVEEVVEQVVEEVITEQSEKTLAETIYDGKQSEQIAAIQKEIEEEVAQYQIPEPETKSVSEVIEEKVEEVIDNTSADIEQKTVEEDVKEVIAEIRKEDDVEKQNKQWEQLLLTLREDYLWLQRDLKERDIEIKTLNKKNEELIEQNKDLKYSDKVKLDDDMAYQHHLREKLKRNPEDAETKKQLAWYYSKAVSGIYPERDPKVMFDEIRTKRQNGIAALTSGSESVIKNEPKEDVNPKIQMAARGVPVKKK